MLETSNSKNSKKNKGTNNNNNDNNNNKQTKKKTTTKQTIKKNAKSNYKKGKCKHWWNTNLRDTKKDHEIWKLLRKQRQTSRNKKRSTIDTYLLSKNIAIEVLQFNTTH